VASGPNDGNNQKSRDSEEYEKVLVASGEMDAEMEFWSRSISEDSSSFNGQSQDYAMSTTYLQSPFTQLDGCADKCVL
jgi:hypothetical protein